ncbi:MSHA biogenesis protein MshN [Colwellia sp. MT41]|uniref:tetratricopeptide repeat protein n=1 Tax=Colwellia sp. MT41 TaxID=58049 RepID=UPI000717AA94|nr:tetratricopeptide repeat protein [Colwellia sp. MT41]ALO36070.1 MSHA biogenesis protein MshN [Colwellia sp. MT41]
MSVINQMLNDLQQRSPDSGALTAPPIQHTQVQSPIKIVVLTTLCVLIIGWASFYIWQLVGENKALKAEQWSNKVNAAQVIAVATLSSPTVSSATTTPANILPVKVAAIENNVLKVLAEKITPAKPVTANTVPAREVKQQTLQGTHARTNAIVDNGASQVTPVKRAAIIVSSDANVEKNTHSHPHTPAELEHASAAKVKSSLQAKSKPQANTMSVSRRQLSADELAQQKFALAEKALAEKHIAKAENLLEDVLIIKPSDSQARKKLAALWFGRQAYQEAINLLSQGIALNGKDSSLREIQARIYLKQGQAIAALNTLKPLADLKDEQYQIMLANTAQHAQQHEAGIAAYKMLITMYPNKGRWQLGLAVLYDKNSQFSLASKAYKAALKNHDLSISSENFVKQRIQVIAQ